MQNPNRKQCVTASRHQIQLVANDEKRKRRTRRGKTKHKSEEKNRSEHLLLVQLIQSDTIDLFHSWRQNAIQAEFSPSEDPKTASWSFASRKLLAHPPNEVPEFIPIVQTGNREEGSTNMRYQKLSVDVKSRQREDCVSHHAGAVSG